MHGITEREREREKEGKVWNILVCFGYGSRQKIEEMFR